ncbi:MAG: PKD domain-containing protein [Bacteroidota bacterium]
MKAYQQLAAHTSFVLYVRICFIGFFLWSQCLFTAPPAKTTDLAFVPKNVLFVVGSTNLNAGDQTIKDRLETDLGHIVSLKDASVSTTDLTGKSLIIISSTISSNALSQNFRDAVRDETTSVITWEHGLYDDFDMSVSGNNTEWSGNDLNILAQGHALVGAAGSTADALSAAAAHPGGTPSSDALIAAELPSGKKVYYAYEMGDNMINQVATGRRIGFFLSDNSADDLTTAGWELFDGAVCWSLEECGNTAPTASFTTSSSSGTAPLIISLDASTSSDPENDPLSYSWDFNDGSTGSGMSLSHTYTYPGVYTITLTVDDGQGLTDQDQVTITVNGTSNYAPTAEIQLERWDGISGSHVSDLTSSSAFSDTPSHFYILTSIFELPDPPTGLADQFGARLSAQFIPPQTGDYTFWIAGDDRAELWLSTNHDPAAKQLIAHNDAGSTSQYQWDKYSSQESAPISLVQGQAYHIEALMKESFGGQHVALKVRYPDGTEEGPVAATNFTLPGTYPPQNVSTLPTTFVKKYGEDHQAEYIITQRADGSYLLLGAGNYDANDPVAAGNVHVVEIDAYGQVMPNGQYVLEVANLDMDIYNTLNPAYSVMPNGEIFYAIRGDAGSSVGMSIFRLDPSARNLVYSKHIELPTYIRPLAAEIDPTDGGNIVLAANNREPMLFKISPTGTVVFSRQIGHRLFQPLDLCTFDNGYSLAVGKYNYSVSSAHETEMHISYLDNNGHTVWAKKYTTAGNEKIIPSIVASHGSASSALIGGKVKMGGEWKIFLADLDLGTQTFGQPRYIDLGHSGELDIEDLQPTSDGGYLLSGGGTPIFSPDSLEKPFLYKINPNGEVEWIKYYDHGFEGEHSTFYQIEQTLDGGFVMGGGHYNLPYDPDFPGLVIRTDANGNLSDPYSCSVNDLPVALASFHSMPLTKDESTLAASGQTLDYIIPFEATGDPSIQHPASWNSITGGNCETVIPDCEHAPFEAAVQTTGINRIISRSPRIAVQDIQTILNDPASHHARDMHEAVAYLDGLGRPLQSVAANAAPDLSDIISFNIYDHLGREVKQYLPFNDAGPAGSFRMDGGTTDMIPDALQTSFFATVLPQMGGPASSNQFPFAEVALEASSLSRPIEQGSVGTPWQLGANAVKTSYGSNGPTEVLMFPAGTAFNYDAGYYPAGELIKTQTTDENGSINIQFTDRLGRMILSMTQIDEGSDLTDPADDTYAQTYYVYDRFGNLTYVLPPEAVQDFVLIYDDPQDPALDKYRVFQFSIDRWGFQYKYDGRQRVIEKKAPGAGWVYSVYNKLDQVVLIQDANQRASGKDEWTFTKYDAFNRPILTGLFDNSLHPITSGYDRAALQMHIDGEDIFENRQNNAVFDVKGKLIEGYSNLAFPNIGLAEVHSVSYYDDYDFDHDQNENASYQIDVEGLGSIPFDRVRGQVTAAFIKVLDPNLVLSSASNPAFLGTITFYDDRGREIQTQADHLHGTDVSSMVVNFAGEIEKTVTRHNGPEGLISVQNRFCYDHQGRLIRSTQKNNDDPEIVLVEQEYDYRSLVVDKQLHSEDGGLTFLQSVDYHFNIRNWLTGINQTDDTQAGPGAGTGDSQNDLFGMDLFYDQTDFLNNTALFNGNISAARWQQGTEDEVHAYNYVYDKNNRILQADYYSTQNNAFLLSTLNRFQSTYSYDLNGNIKQLTRRGLINSGNFGLMDDLTYTYQSQGGNHLMKVEDAVAGGSGNQFIDGSNIGDDYAYDDNGNLITDLNKNISISYNHLNKPVRVSFTGGPTNGSWIDYIYDAAGTKLQMRTGGSSTQTTDYINGFHYQDGALDFFAHAEGRVVGDGANNLLYQYQIADHLGNSRVYFEDDAGTASVIQVDAYYPFGLNMSFDNGQAIANPENRYRYNGKEEQTAFGLGWYDYGARMYEAVLGRFTGGDPIAEDFHWVTPYNYAENEPIANIDLWGLQKFKPPVNHHQSGPDNNVGPSRAQIEHVNNHKAEKSREAWNEARGIKKVDPNSGGEINPTPKLKYHPGAGEFGGRVAEGLGQGLKEAALDFTGLKLLDLGSDAIKGSKLLNVPVTKIDNGGKGILPDDAAVVRGGTNTPELIKKGTGTHPEGVTGVSVECGTCSVKELAKPLPHGKIGVTTVGDVRNAGGDVIKTSGRSPNHATLTGLSPEKTSELLNPVIRNPNKK